MTVAELGVILAAICTAAWLADLYFHPYGRCWRCRGRGTNWGSRRAASGDCPKCAPGRKGQRYRFMARHISKQAKRKGKR